MTEIIPALLERDYNQIKNKVGNLVERVKFIQLDICDGIFVQNKTWPFVYGFEDDFHFKAIINEEEGLPYWEEMDFELDLMTLDAVANFDLYAKLGAKRIIFHLEAQKDFTEFQNFLESLDSYFRDNINIGLAFRPSADLEQVIKLSGDVDFLQCMGIERVGFQGEKLDQKIFENIKILKERLPGIVISVDGGVNLENAGDLIDAGVDRLVVGSAIWRATNPLSALEDFENLV